MIPVDGGFGVLQVRLIQTRIGGWRVLSAMPPGRNPDHLPWGLG